MELYSLPVNDNRKGTYNKVLIEIYEPRKLRAKWTPEAAEDLQAFHSIDAEAELTAALRAELEKIKQDNAFKP